MELYELTLHFPGIYKGFQLKPLYFTCSEYFGSRVFAVEWAKMVANAFVTPRPSFWYLSDGPGFNIWTDNIELTAIAIKYDRLDPKPTIRKVNDEKP